MTSEAPVYRVTAVVTIGFGTLWSLLYVVDVSDPTSAEEIVSAIATERLGEIGDENDFPAGALWEEIKEGLDLRFVFAGDVNVLVDFRN